MKYLEMIITLIGICSISSLTGFGMFWYYMILPWHNVWLSMLVGFFTSSLMGILIFVLITSVMFKGEKPKGGKQK